MIRIFGAAILIAMTAALSGCFMSEKSLIEEAQASAPYAKITYSDSSGGEKQVLTREGTHYVIKSDNGEVGMVRFLAVGDDLYVAEAGGKDRDGKVTYLYALLKIDPAKGTATAYKAIASDFDMALPKGLSDCGKGSDKTVCITDLKSYADYAKAAMTLGAKPDTVWQYTTE